MKKTALTFLLPLFFLPACSSLGPQSADLAAPDSGVLEVDQYIVPAGQTQTIDKDLAVFANQEIEIDGTLEVKPGVSLALFSAGPITINGQILGSEEDPEPVASHFNFQSLFLGSAVAAPGELPDWILYGDGIAISKNATVQSGKGSNVQITTHDSNGKIEIDGTVKTPDGRDAKSRDEDGKDAPSIQIGSDAAVNNIKYRAKALGKPLDTAQPGYVRVAGTLDAGNGGDGFTDLKGVEGAGNLDLRGTNGGAGGDIEVSADKLELTGTISAGQGGDGGGAGDPATQGTHARDGVRDGDKGFDLSFVTGNGGRGGNIDLMEGPVGKAKEVESGQVGRGGKAGWVYASAGNGKNWGAGGNLKGKIGNIGFNGFMNSVIGDSTEALKASGTFANGGNGGDSTDPGHAGGNGGTLSVTNPDGGKADLSGPLTFQNYGNGGQGFNGCGASFQDGTDGGNSFNSPVVPVAVYGAAYTVASKSFSGGRGGDGDPRQGFGGSLGFDDSLKDIGVNGDNGRPCKKTLSVILDYPQGVYFAGQIIALDRIQGYKISEPDAACMYTHLHASSPEGIFIDGKGPFYDPAPNGCGFGLVSLQ